MYIHWAFSVLAGFFSALYTGQNCFESNYAFNMFLLTMFVFNLVALLINLQIKQNLKK